MLMQLRKNTVLFWILRVAAVPLVLVMYLAGILLNLLFSVCGSVGTVLCGLGGLASVLALLDHCYAEAAASALVAILVSPIAVPQLALWAGNILMVAASALYVYLYQ